VDYTVTRRQGRPLALGGAKGCAALVRIEEIRSSKTKRIQKRKSYKQHRDTNVCTSENEEAELDITREGPVSDTATKVRKSFLKKKTKSKEKRRNMETLSDRTVSSESDSSTIDSFHSVTPVTKTSI